MPKNIKNSLLAIILSTAICVCGCTAIGKKLLEHPPVCTAIYEKKEGEEQGKIYYVCDDFFRTRKRKENEYQIGPTMHSIRLSDYAKEARRVGEIIDQHGELDEWFSTKYVLSYKELSLTSPEGIEYSYRIRNINEDCIHDNVEDKIKGYEPLWDIVTIRAQIPEGTLVIKDVGLNGGIAAYLNKTELDEERADKEYEKAKKLLFENFKK